MSISSIADYVFSEGMKILNEVTEDIIDEESQAWDDPFLLTESKIRDDILELIAIKFRGEMNREEEE